MRMIKKFQSTHPLRDATKAKYMEDTEKKDFNPRTPYGMRQSVNKIWFIENNFNPRTPYGMRPDRFYMVLFHWQFQSTHPLRDATEINAALFGDRFISIHAPLTGCDEINRV